MVQELVFSNVLRRRSNLFSLLPVIAITLQIFACCRFSLPTFVFFTVLTKNFEQINYFIRFGVVDKKLDGQDTNNKKNYGRKFVINSYKKCHSHNWYCEIAPPLRPFQSNNGIIAVWRLNCAREFMYIVCMHLCIHIVWLRFPLAADLDGACAFFESCPESRLYPEPIENR